MQLDAMFTGAGSVKQPHGMGSLRATHLSWEGTSVGDLMADVELDGEAANIRARALDLNSQLTAPSMSARRTQRPPISAATASTSKTDPASSFLPDAVDGPRQFYGARRRSAGAVARGGSAARGDGARSATGDLPIRLAEPARASGSLTSESRSIGLDAMAGATRISASGALPLFDDRPVRQARVRELLTASQLQPTATSVRLLARMPQRAWGQFPLQRPGPLALRARVVGSLEKPIITSDLAVGPGSVSLEGLSTATDVRLRAHLENEVVDLQEAHAAYEGATLDAELDSTGSRRVGNRTVDLRNGVAACDGDWAYARGVARSARSTALEDLAGVVEIAVDLQMPSTDVSQVTGDITLTRLDLEMAGFPLPTRADAHR